jgi:protein-S-isoprenylcysteine O-methyltransferase Ste14
MGDERQNGADNPGVIPPPPLVYAGALASTDLLANRVYPISILPRGFSRTLGWPSVVAGLPIGLLLGVREMKRAQKNVDSYKPTTAIVAAGPYRHTRNPLYVGMTWIYASVSARANALCAALLLPVVLVVVRRWVIEREERYLERKFGDEYSRYKERERRWI